MSWVEETEPQVVTDTEIKEPQQAYVCPHCGARVVGEICEYCGSTTGIETATATMLYPELKVLDYTYKTQEGRFLLLFTAMWEGITTVVSLGFLAFAFAPGESFGGVSIGLFVGPMLGFFHIIGISIGIRGLALLHKRKTILSKGRTLEATCFGFTDSAIKWLVEYNGNPMFMFTPRSADHREYQVGWKMDYKELGCSVCAVENSLRTK